MGGSYALGAQDVRDYASAAARLGTRDRVKVANNTYLERRDEFTIAVHYHATDVVTFHADGRIILQSGGWYTYTTKTRLGHFSPVSVRSIRGRWHVQHGPRRNPNTGRWEDDSPGPMVPYVDGMDVGAETLPVTDTSAEDAANRETEKAIRNYLRGLTDEKFRELVEDAAANGTAGDCWYCAMRETETGVPIGDAFGTLDHLRSHLAERYYMASLLRNAVAAGGYRTPAFILHCAPGLARDALGKYLRKRLRVGAVNR